MTTATLVTILLVIGFTQVCFGVLRFEKNRKFEGTGFRKFTEGFDASVKSLHLATTTEENLGTAKSAKRIMNHSYAYRSSGRALVFKAVLLSLFYATQWIMQQFENRNHVSPGANAAALDSEALS